MKRAVIVIVSMLLMCVLNYPVKADLLNTFTEEVEIFTCDIFNFCPTYNKDESDIENPTPAPGGGNCNSIPEQCNSYLETEEPGEE